MKFGITSHTIVRNEDRFIWFAIQSIINHVDKMIIYDTGSSDQTVSIIKSIRSPKITFKSFSPQTPSQITSLRQKQLNLTKTPWFMILDGDEVWWKNSIQQAKQTAKSNPKLWGIITPTINCIGDIYHYQEEQAGNYQFAGYKGHLAVRLMKKLPNLKVKNNYPLEGYYATTTKQITDFPDKLKFVDSPYLHLTNLNRSTSSKSAVHSREKKYELGTKFTEKLKYPESFYHKPPLIVPNPWVKASFQDKIISTIQTPLKKIKRRII